MSAPARPFRGFHPALALALIGAATGVVESLLDGEDALHFFGLVFGAPVALSLLWAFRVSWWRALVIFALFEASWQAALRLAISLVDEYDTNPYFVGGISGLIGAAIVLVGFTIALPAFRRPVAWALPLASGTLLGAALLLPALEEDMIAILLVGWQAGLGAALGWGLRAS